MFIKSNEKTISVFNPDSVEKYKDDSLWDDQLYLNNNRDILKIQKLPCELFPTGRYYYENYKKINPYLIHFNWLFGHEKKEKMIFHNKWYLKSDKQIKI